jgi:staphylococcal nuclease domain-containing protein 1
MSNPESSKPIILPKTGVARVKSVMSGDTVILLGKAPGPNSPPPEVIFTFESMTSPR